MWSVRRGRCSIWRLHTTKFCFVHFLPKHRCTLNPRIESTLRGKQHQKDAAQRSILLRQSLLLNAGTRSLTNDNLQQELKTAILNSTELGFVFSGQIVELGVSSNRSLTREERCIVQGWLLIGLVGPSALGSSRFRANDKHRCRKASNSLHGSCFIQPSSSSKAAARSSVLGKGLVNGDICYGEYISLSVVTGSSPSLLTEYSAFISTSGWPTLCQILSCLFSRRNLP